MDKVNMCLERIRVIRGVNYGIITYKQIQNVFELYQLDEGQKRAVFESLKKSRVSPAQDDMVMSRSHGTSSAKKMTEPRTLNIEKDDQKDELLKEKRRKRFEEKLQQCRRDINDNSELASQYEEELTILKDKLVEQSSNQKKRASRCISNALLYVSSFRVCEVRKHGWVCGTYMSRVRERFENWIKLLFSEEELCELINICASNGELNRHQLDMVTVLLHNTPKTLVHRYYTFP